MTGPGPARPPRSIVAVGVVGLLVLAAPLVALAWRAPWGRLLSLLTAPEARTALWLSLGSGALATLIAVLLGVPLAVLLASSDQPPMRIARLGVLVPMVLPPVVVGVALLMLLGRRGLIGSGLDAVFGWTPTYAFAGVVIAQLVVSMPFLVITVENALRSRDVDAEESAYTLGAGPMATFWRVTLPSVRPAIVAGAVMCFARALGEFGATITFAGNVSGVTQTMPLSIYLALQNDPDSAIAMAIGLVVVSLLVLVVMHRRRLWSAADG